MSNYQYITYEPLDDGMIVRIMLNRPDTRRAGMGSGARC